MRGLSPVAIGCAVLLSYSGSSRVSDPGSKCVPSERAGTSSCKNLLPFGFAEFKTQEQLRTLKTALDSVAQTLADSGANEPRAASRKCTFYKPWQNNDLRIQYHAPKAMLVFPDSGTDGRSLVIGMFTVSTDNDCWEADYGVQIDTEGNWKRRTQFTAVTTWKDAQMIGDKRVVGEWATFALLVRGVVGAEEYRLKKLESGRYVQCNSVHYKDPQQPYVSFTGCDGGKQLHDLLARKIVPGVETIEQLVDLYNSNARGVRLLTRSGGTAAAWAAVRQNEVSRDSCSLAQV
jgi:hypothetical protein